MNAKGPEGPQQTRTDPGDTVAGEVVDPKAIAVAELELRDGLLVVRIGSEARIVGRWRDFEPFLGPAAEGDA